MSIFYEKFTELCKQQKTFPCVVAKELGIPPASVTDWKKGRIPREKTIEKIAKYFSVTIDYLWGRENAPADPFDGDADTMKVFSWYKELSEDQQKNIADTIKLYRQLNEANKKR